MCVFISLCIYIYIYVYIYLFIFFLYVSLVRADSRKSNTFSTKYNILYLLAKKCNTSEQSWGGRNFIGISVIFPPEIFRLLQNVLCNTFRNKQPTHICLLSLGKFQVVHTNMCVRLVCVCLQVIFYAKALNSVAEFVARCG